MLQKGRIHALLAALLVLTAWTIPAAAASEKDGAMDTVKKEQPAVREIYFAGGCFWGVEEYFSRIPGVLHTSVGYANGRTDQPDYAAVCSGQTGHAETVRVLYDPKKVSLSTLARQFFKIIDPTSLNRQGNDAGTQYRTGIYYTDPSERPALAALMEEVQTGYKKTLAVELVPLQAYWRLRNTTRST